MAKGFVYLCAIIDWYSRKVLNYRVSISLEVDPCIEVLEEAISKYGAPEISKYGAPEIFNTYQGSQFTCERFISVLKHHDIQISMDGRGRWMDNVMIERLWRSRASGTTQSTRVDITYRVRGCGTNEWS